MHLIVDETDTSDACKISDTLELDGKLLTKGPSKIYPS